MTDLDTIARRHAEQARAVVADARLPRLDTGRRRRVRWVPRPVWAAVITAAAVMLVFALPVAARSGQKATTGGGDHGPGLRR